VQQAGPSDARRLFARALDSGAPVSIGTFLVGGRRVAVRCLGGAHWDDLQRSLIAVDDGPPDLRLDIWDVDELGFRPGRTAAEAETLATGPEVVVYSPGGRELRHLGEDFDMLLEEQGRRATGWISAAKVPAWHRLRPWQRVFVAALAADGAESVHASMVSRDGAGVLLTGPSGTGKSTTTFACLAAGLRCLGDDTIAIDLDGGPPQASAVHVTVKVSVDQLARFPDFSAASDPVADPARNERALRLGGHESRYVAPRASVAAIAFPHLGAGEASSSRPLPPARAATELLRNGLALDGGRLDRMFAALTRLAESVPCFALEVGRDPAGLAAAVDALLDRPA
jgi:hypothetical protein